MSATLSAPLSPLFGSPKPKPTQPTSQPSSPDRAKELFGKFGQSVGWAGRWDTPTHTECMTMGTSINPDSPLVAMPFSLSFHRGNYYARGADDGWRGLIRAEGRSVGRSDGRCPPRSHGRSFPSCSNRVVYREAVDGSMLSCGHSVCPLEEVRGEAILRESQRWDIAGIMQPERERERASSCSLFLYPLSFPFLAARPETLRFVGITCVT